MKLWCLSTSLHGVTAQKTCIDADHNTPGLGLSAVSDDIVRDIFNFRFRECIGTGSIRYFFENRPKKAYFCVNNVVADECVSVS